MVAVYYYAAFKNIKIVFFQIFVSSCPKKRLLVKCPVSLKWRSTIIAAGVILKGHSTTHFKSRKGHPLL